ncbi:MAG TPA: SDR family oxidoreductase [Polyangiaceae bacterium]|nr:SDR family oxidoreductase [Polyangiaceae bacterium]
MKQIGRQTIVITGASSGIGLSTARLAASRGARVVLTARSEPELAQVTEDLIKQGGMATYYPADVADYDALRRVAEHAHLTFGHIDTWVNNAGATVYGMSEVTSLDDMRRVFDVTYWGVVHGSLIALPYLRQTRGTLINVGSVESDVPFPLTSTYAAAKHAVKGFTDALRMELKHEKSQVQVTLVKPAAIDTPFFEHAKNYLESAPKPPPPLYDPEKVARVILRAAQKPEREVVAGGAANALIRLHRTAPRLAEWVFAKTMVSMQKSDRPNTQGSGALYEPGHSGRERGGGSRPPTPAATAWRDPEHQGT